MIYNATEEQINLFKIAHEEIKKTINLGKEILWLTKDDFQAAKPSVEETLGIVKQALTAHGKKECEVPAKLGFQPFPEVFYHAMPAYLPAAPACGVKWIEAYPDNPKKYNLPQITGLMIMNDIMTGVPIAVMDGTSMTAMRTPAVTVLAADVLHSDAKTFGMIGCGVQGAGHVLYAAKGMKNLEKIYIFDNRLEIMDQLISEIGPLIDIEIIKADSIQQLCSKCDVMCTATVILKEPLRAIKKEWVSKGQTIFSCDVNTLWDPFIAKEADQFIVDCSLIHKSYEDRGYFPDGMPKITCETGEVVAGIAKGRTSKDELIFSSNVGIAISDVAMGKFVLDKAIQMGLGQKVPL